MIDGAFCLLFIIPFEGIKTMKLDVKTEIRQVASQIFLPQSFVVFLVKQSFTGWGKSRFIFGCMENNTIFNK